MIQMHRNGMIVCDEDATMDLKMKTYRYFKGLQKTNDTLITQGKALGYSTDMSEPNSPRQRAMSGEFKTEKEKRKDPIMLELSLNDFPPSSSNAGP